MAWETLEKQLDAGAIWQPSSSLVESSDSDSQETSSEETLERSWKSSAKWWTPEIWAHFDLFLLANGYELCAKRFYPSTSYLEDPNTYLLQRASATLDDFYPFENLRKARSLHYPSAPVLYIRAIIPGPESDEIRVLSLLAASGVRNRPKNFANATVDVLKTTVDGVTIYFVVQIDAGQPCFNFSFIDNALWRQFVLDCFEGLDFLHSLGIAHLDMQALFIFDLPPVPDPRFPPFSGPMNVLYDGCTSRPTFIDLEGCQLVGNGTSIDKLTHKQKVALWKPPLAVNARLPELGKPFDPFAADCWMLGDMLLQMRRFPEDDLTALFRFMSSRSLPTSLRRR